MRYHSILHHFLVALLAYMTIMFFCTALGVLPTAHAASSHAHQQSLRNVSTDSPPCPIFSQDELAAPPAIVFCSPQYNGYLGGTFGAHVVIMGQGFTHEPTKIVIIDQNKVAQPTSIDLVNHCNKPTCFALPRSAIQWNSGSQQLFAAFTWQFQGNVQDNFAAVALQGNSIQASTDPTYAFTLVSSQPPCITITDASKQSGAADCTQPQQPVTLTAGTSILIKGSGWLLYPAKPLIKQTITITACNESDKGCKQQKLFSVTAQPDEKGNFAVPYKLPGKVAGVYEITASNHIANPVPAHTAANQTLTFGESGDATQSTLQVNLPTGHQSTAYKSPSLRPSPPPPLTPPWDLSDTLSLLAMLPAMIAVLYLWQRSKAIQGAPAGVDGSTASDANATTQSPASQDSSSTTEAPSRPAYQSGFLPILNMQTMLNIPTTNATTSHSPGQQEETAAPSEVHNEDGKNDIDASTGKMDDLLKQLLQAEKYLQAIDQEQEPWQNMERANNAKKLLESMVEQNTGDEDIADIQGRIYQLSGYAHYTYYLYYNPEGLFSFFFKRRRKKALSNAVERYKKALMYYAKGADLSSQVETNLWLGDAYWANFCTTFAREPLELAYQRYCFVYPYYHDKGESDEVFQILSHRLSEIRDARKSIKQHHNVNSNIM